MFDQRYLALLLTCAACSSDAAFEASALTQPLTADAPALAAFGSVSACDGAWATLKELAAGEGNVARLSAAVSGGQLCVRVEGSQLDRNYFNMFIETDNDPSTGLSAAPWLRNGADYLFDAWALRAYKGPGFEWTAIDNADIGSLPSDKELKLRVALTSLQGRGGAALAEDVRIGLGFQLRDAADQYLPRADALARLGEAPACASVPAVEMKPPVCMRDGKVVEYPAAPQFASNRGMLIPAYLRIQPTDTDWEQKRAAWQLLADGATQVTERGYDYWVAVTGPNKGPFDAAEDWVHAREVWAPIQSAHGRIFGYVHTRDEVAPKLIPLETVEKQIAQWACGYPELDGIWIDEFYPQFERAADAEGKLVNGEALAPSESGPGDLHANCGYYDRLRKWISANYPHLRVIGNAGGTLDAHLQDYARLVDLLVPFESNKAEANDATYPLDSTARVLANKAIGYGALFHSVASVSDLDELLERALAAQYTHVYATDVVFTPAVDVWGSLPSPAWSNELPEDQRKPSFQIEIDHVLSAFASHPQ